MEKKWPKNINLFSTNDIETDKESDIDFPLEAEIVAFHNFKINNDKGKLEKIKVEEKIVAKKFLIRNDNPLEQTR